jgi:hypothetical protein
MAKVPLPLNNDDMANHRSSSNSQYKWNKVNPIHDKVGFTHTISIVENSSTIYDAHVYDSESNLIQSFQIESIVYPKVKLVDINLDGYTDIVVSTGGTLNETHQIFVWDTDETLAYIPIDFVGFDILSYYEINQGYLMNWVKDDANTVVVQKLTWNDNSLILESQETYDVSDD